MAQHPPRKRVAKPVDPARLAAETDVLCALDLRDFQGAARVVSSYEAKQPTVRGMGIDWANKNHTSDVIALRAIYGPTPGILAGIDPQALVVLRDVAALMFLWGTGGSPLRRWLPSDIETGIRFGSAVSARMLVFAGYQARVLANYRHEFSTARFVSIIGVGDSRTCDTCRAINCSVHLIDSIPEIPHPGCTSVMGCRCGTRSQHSPVPPQPRPLRALK